VAAVDLDAGTIALLVGAAVAAGAVNAIAGGGSLISFPALLLAGYPAVAANATNLVAVVPGYLGGSIGYRRELQAQRRRAIALGLTAAVGAVGGAVLLVVAPSLFERLAPFLVLTGCAVLAAQPLVNRRRGAPVGAGKGHRSVGLHLLVLVASVYGGFFGAALGIVLLGVLGIFLTDDIQSINALKGWLSLVGGLVSAGYLLLFGPVVLVTAAMMAGATLAGGQLGARIAQGLPADVLRWTVVAFGVTVAIVLLATG
jgi:uncharacterized protein